MAAVVALGSSPHHHGGTGFQADELGRFGCHGEQCPQNLAEAWPQEGAAQPWSLQCPLQNPCDQNRDNLFPKPFLQHPMLPWEPQDPQSCHCSRIWSPQIPQDVVTDLSGLRLEFYPLPPAPPRKTARFRGLQPTQTHTDTLRPSQGGQKRLQAGKFSRAAPSAAKSPRSQPKSRRPRACVSHNGQDTVPTGLRGCHGALGRVSPPQLHPGATAKLAQPGPNAAGRLWDTMSPRRPHRDTATAREKVPGKAWPGAGGAAGTAEPRGSCNTEKAGSARQARGSSGAAWKSGPEGGEGGEGRQQNTPGSLC